MTEIPTAVNATPEVDEALPEALRPAPPPSKLDPPTIISSIHIMGDFHVAYDSDNFERIEIKTDHQAATGHADLTLSLHWVADREALAQELETVARAIREAAKS